MIKIVMTGDFNAAKTSHQADKLVTELYRKFDDSDIIWDWIETSDLTGNLQLKLNGYNGIWCVPGSPFLNMDGVLAAIRYSRESGTPFLGTCAGFQHAVIEFARNVLQIKNADHTESHPGAEMPLIDLLECSLVEKTAAINIEKDTRLSGILKKNTIEETYHCRYGINRKFEKIFDNTELRIAGRDTAGEIRAIELTSHPFFICTLFQIERSALKGERHQLIEAFIQAASDRSKLIPAI